MNTLHVFSNEVPDWVVAYDPDDAIKIWEETYGEKYDLEESGGEFIQESDDHRFTLFSENQDDMKGLPEDCIELAQDESFRCRMTNKEWIDIKGRGFLGSAEY
jgi:hypothetical protein